MDPQDRRSFLSRTVGVAGALGVLGVLGGGVAGATRPTNESLDAAVTVTVGPGANLVFEPELTRIWPGTRVRFVWESDNHNVVVDEQPGGADWDGTPGERDVVYDTGYEFTHTFETPGRYEFHCEPHQSAGMTGAVEAFEPDVTVTVGPEGTLVYDPETVEVDPGDVVRWVWDSDNHDVAVESHPDDAAFAGTPGDEFYDAGYEFLHPFETVGTHEYYCTPHRAAGMEGTVVVGDGATDTPVSGEATVDVGPENQFYFEPEDLTVERGTDVTWVWRGDNHNVVVDSQPDGAHWEGTPGDETQLYGEGYEYSHTFEVVGTYEYHCEPHLSAGMTGSIEVVDPAATGTRTTTGERTTAGGATEDGATTGGDDETDAVDFDDEGESIPFSGPAVVGAGALTAGALARLRRRLDDD